MVESCAGRGAAYRVHLLLNLRDARDGVGVLHHEHELRQGYVAPGEARARMCCKNTWKLRDPSGLSRRSGFRVGSRQKPSIHFWIRGVKQQEWCRFERGIPRFKTMPLSFLNSSCRERYEWFVGIQPPNPADLQSSEFTVGILGTRIELFVALDSNDLIQTTRTPEPPSKTHIDRSVSSNAFE